MLPPFVIIYPFGPADESFKAPEQYEEYPVVLCGDTVILYDGLLAACEYRQQATSAA